MGRGKLKSVLAEIEGLESVFWDISAKLGKAIIRGYEAGNVAGVLELERDKLMAVRMGAALRRIKSLLAKGYEIAAAIESCMIRNSIVDDYLPDVRSSSLLSKALVESLRVLSDLCEWRSTANR